MKVGNMKSVSSRLLLFGCVVGVGLNGIASARAAAVGDAVQASSGVASQSAGAATAGTPTPPQPNTAPYVVQEVVVTANKRIQSIQTVPGQITALTAADFDRLQVRSFGDFADYVPGLSFQSNGPASNLISIRGVNTGGTQLSAAVGVYVDDVPIGASSAFGLGASSFNINTYDLQRLEVLNGPQGTVYGANSLGGALKYVTATPDLNGYAVRAEIEGSNTDHGGDNGAVRGAVNVPFLDNRGALRVDLFDQYDSGYTDDPDHGRTRLGTAKTTGGRFSVLLKPADDVTVRFTALQQEILTNGSDLAFRSFSDRKPTEGEYDQSLPVEQNLASSLQLYSTAIDWDLHWAKLTSITADQFERSDSITDVSYIYDGILASADAFGLPVRDTTSKFTQELRLTSPDHGAFTWLIGGFYDHEKTKEVVDLFDFSNQAGTLFGLTPFLSNLPSSYTEYAAFADGTLHLPLGFGFTFGLRYSHDDQRYGQTSSGLFNNPAAPFTISQLKATSREDTVTYLINPTWQVNHDLLVYGRVSSGFRPGGPNFVLAPGLGTPSFAADTLWNYELGLKSTLLQGKATFNADIYDIDWANIQLTVNVGGINQLTNAGDARIQGAEFSTTYRLLQRLTLGANGSYTDARLNAPTPQLGIGYAEARLPLSPRFNGAVTADYSFDLGHGYGGDVTVADRYVGDRTAGFAGSVIQPLYKLDSYNTVDLNLAIRTPKGVEVDLYAKNLANSRGEVSATTAANEYNPAAPVPVIVSQPLTAGFVFKLAFGG